MSTTTTTTRKYFFTPSCSNNSKKNSDKYFFRVPYDRNLRDRWCEAIGRETTIIKQTSTAYCCSDHFNLALDLDRYSSSIGNPKLKRGTIPKLSVKPEHTLTRNGNMIKTLDIFRTDDMTPENLYVREVVYIEENQNDRFLEEGNDLEDTVNIEPNIETKNETVTMMQPNRNLLKSAPASSTPIQKQIVPHINKKLTHSSLKIVPRKPLILRHITQMNSLDKKLSEKSIPMPIAPKIPPKNQLPIARIGKPMTLNAKLTPDKMKYSKYDEFKKFRNQQNLNCSRTKSADHDDDDCIVVEEKNVLNNDKTIVRSANTEANSSMKILTSLPPSISIKYSNGVRPVKYSNGGTLSLAAASKPSQFPSQVPLSSAKALVFQSKLSQVQMQEVTYDRPNVTDDDAFNLIKLMISENQMLLAKKKDNCVNIVRTKPNEFKILNNVYYYRTNNSFENNYFFMNITRNSLHSYEIIQRNYGIYWGYPRRSCVGIVETKGTLDDQTKDFVFQQVKKSLLENGEPSLMLMNPTQPRIVQTDTISKTKTVKFIKMPTKDAPAVQLDSINDQKLSSPKRRVKLIVSDAISKSPQTVKPTLSVKPTTIPRPVKSISNPKILQDEDHRENELIRLSNYLTPAIRKLINNLKYFELNDKCYTINISEDRLAKKTPYNIVFTENKMKSGIQSVSKQLYVSKLVTYLFKAVYPFMNNPSNKPIPIPPPPDITSNISPQVLESILISESRNTNNSNHANSNKNKFKHECNICLQNFERKYQLMRHQFVEHNIDQTDPVTTITNSTSAILSTVPEAIRKFMAIPMESPTSELQSNTHIKTEKLEETSDRSLLVPLFEIPMELQNQYPTDFSMLKCKEEPEEHFEITEMPFSTQDMAPVKPKQKARKRKHEVRVAEDTDSATECLDSAPGSSRRKRRKDGKMSNVKEFKDLVEEVKQVEVRKGQQKSIRDQLKARKWFQ